MEWWRSAREGAERAMRSLVGLNANTALGAYEAFPFEIFQDLIGRRKPSK
jgi:hypothetical protein